MDKECRREREEERRRLEKSHSGKTEKDWEMEDVSGRTRKQNRVRKEQDSVNRDNKDEKD